MEHNEENEREIDQQPESDGRARFLISEELGHSRKSVGRMYRFYAQTILQKTSQVMDCCPSMPGKFLVLMRCMVRGRPMLSKATAQRE